jgi:hypothetical protein
VLLCMLMDINRVDASCLMHYSCLQAPTANIRNAVAAQACHIRNTSASTDTNQSSVPENIPCLPIVQLLLAAGRPVAVHCCESCSASC